LRVSGCGLRYKRVETGATDFGVISVQGGFKVPGVKVASPADGLDCVQALVADNQRPVDPDMRPAVSGSYFRVVASCGHGINLRGGLSQS